MIEFNLYEGINCERSHKYDRIVCVTDIFCVRKVYKKNKNNRVEMLTNKRSIRYFDKSYIKGCYLIEFKITDSDLLKNILLSKGEEIILNRYVVSWGYDGYFLNTYKGFLSIQDDDILIFDIYRGFEHIGVNELNITPKQIRRDMSIEDIFK